MKGDRPVRLARALTHAADIELAARAAARDETELRGLLERLSPRLLRIGWHMSHDHHEAENLCQEALMKITAPTVLRGYRGEGALDGYLVGVGVRAMISRQRLRRGWRDHVALVDEPPSVGASPEVEAGGLSAPVRTALAALPERARLVVLLIAIGDLTYAQVGAALGLEVGTVKSTYSRARAALRESLAPAV